MKKVLMHLTPIFCLMTISILSIFNVATLNSISQYNSNDDNQDNGTEGYDDGNDTIQITNTLNSDIKQIINPINTTKYANIEDAELYFDENNIIKTKEYSFDPTESNKCAMNTSIGIDISLPTPVDDGTGIPLPEEIYNNYYVVRFRYRTEAYGSFGSDVRAISLIINDISFNRFDEETGTETLMFSVSRNEDFSNGYLEMFDYILRGEAVDFPENHFIQFEFYAMLARGNSYNIKINISSWAQKYGNEQATTDIIYTTEGVELI